MMKTWMAVVLWTMAAGAVAAEKFPMTAAEIGFGKTLADFGVRDAKTVFAQDFGFNPSNATAAIQKAIDSGATTVVIDAMPTPWYVDSLSPRSNQRILLKKGAKVMMDKTTPKKRRGPLFSIKQVKNVIVEGEGKESFVGGYASYEERKANCKWYGKSAFALDRATNVVIRSLRVADSEEDGVFFGGDLRCPSVDTWLENLDLDSHYRQACSICCADGVFCTNVTFRNTRGNEPSAGIDVEPAYPCSPNTRMHLFDCRFENNNGGGIVFATCSDYPIRFYAKGCSFGPQENAVISVPARGEAYFPKKIKPDVKIVFEDCDIESYSNVPAIGYSTAPLFDCTFRRIRFRDNGRMGYWKEKTPTSPLFFRLDRDYGPDNVPAHMVGVSTFEDVTIEGWKGKPVLAFADELGKVSVKKAFRGTVAFNGGKVNLASFKYEAPDLFEPRLKRVSVKDLLSPSLIPRPSSLVPHPSNCSISWNGAWFQELPAYTYFFHAEKGAKVSFTVTYPEKIVYEDMKKKLSGQHLQIETPQGWQDAGEMKPGANKVDFTAPETGWYSFRPPCQDGEGNKVPVTDVQGAALAWQSDTLGDSLGKFVLKDEKKDYRGYFEVPPNVECRLRVTWGSLELYDADGKLVDTCEAGKYVGRHTFRFRAKGDKPEVWSFRTPPGGGTRVLKFYAPLNGIWADSPELLPRDVSRYFDWDAAKEIAKGIRVAERVYDWPRRMAAYLMRIDLRTPGLRFTGTERAENWDEPMPDVTNRVVKIDTRRETVPNFMKRRRAKGENMVAAFNTAPWGPWEKPFNHKFAHFDTIQVSDGVNVSHAAKGGWPHLVILKDNTAYFTNMVEEAECANMVVAHSGFGTVLRDCVFPAAPAQKPGLAPRTAYGVSRDGRYLYVLAVDGRQPGYSLGADMFDLANILSAAGAVNGINVDGGGSTTLAYWDEATRKPFVMNHHDPNKGYYRPVALSVGVILEK